MNPVELLYYLGYLFKKKADLRHRRRLPHRVISVGNVTVGGTGKTPAVISLARAAQGRGLLPVILTRGYRGKVPGPCFVGDGIRSLTGLPAGEPPSMPLDPSLFGDEPVLMAERLPGVPVVKCADRYEGGVFALRFLPEAVREVVVFILDDGFQHLRLHRDFDIVLVDGLNPFGNGRLLPLGPLREPLGSLKRADLFLMTRCENPSLRDRLSEIQPRAPVFRGMTVVRGLSDPAGSPVDGKTLAGRRVCAFCGIGNPEAFRQTATGLGGTLAGFRGLGDHHRYRRPDLGRLERWARGLGCDFLVTTEKDRVKLRHLDPPANILSVEIDLPLEPALCDRVFSPLPAAR